jgi:hypothetical protein
MTSVPAHELRRLHGSGIWKPPPRPWFAAAEEGCEASDEESESGPGGKKEVLVAFTRVFSGVLRAGDPSDAQSGGGGGSTTSPLFILGPKHEPLLAGSAGALSECRLSRPSPHVTPLDAAAFAISQGLSTFAVPESNLPATAAVAAVAAVSEGIATTAVTAGGDAEAAGKADGTSVAQQQRSPIALYLMMGDALLPVSSVPAVISATT